MRFATVLLLACAVFGQTYTYDSDGKPTVLPAIQETRKRKVVEDGPNGRVVEETVERRDAAGNPLPLEKLRIVERKGADGANVVETTTFRSDLNGRLAPAERNLVSTRQQGELTTTTTTLEKPNLNGGFEAVEKSASQTMSADGRQTTNRSVYLPDVNGNFVEAIRERKEQVPDGKATKEVTQEYRNAATGSMELSGQRVTVSFPNPDGSTTSEITIYGVAAPGRPADGQMHVREQQLVTLKPTANGGAVESLSIRRPNLSDDKMGAYQKISEKILPPAKP
ncbi:hypothetical protein [Bryobacter aggregatus]|uniref:hypothetical protein n=1 Tax=Bryobacter aggregatus TaxID=360054 RepID=UPI0004E1E82E|nr:hypothetical protein [Bryobacter aggregatus]